MEVNTNPPFMPVHIISYPLTIICRHSHPLDVQVDEDDPERDMTMLEQLQQALQTPAN